MIDSVIDGRYRVTRLLGAGAMGSVYEAEHTGTGRRVAVKVINAGDLSRNEMLISRFQREAKAAGAIDTQHITQVLDTGTDRDSGLPYMVMEYLGGEDLQQALKRLGPIAPDLALRIVAQSCLGLQKAHEAGVVHRDIKPANLFLARRDAGEITVKLLDFGIAKVKMDHANETESAGLTRTGNMLGSPLYMSPEQARGTRNIDHRADIWSLGIVLYQSLTGRTPYAHINALGELIIAICHDPPQLVQDFAPWVTPEVAAIVHGALRINPAERFESASAMFNALKPLLPYGWTITQEMLAPLPPQVKQFVAPRLELTANATAQSLMDSRNSALPGDIAQRSSSGSAGADATASALVHSQVSQQRSGSKLPIAVGAVVLAVLGGAGLYVATRRPAEVLVEPAVQAQQTTASAVAPTPPPPVPTAQPAPSETAATAAAAAAKRVKLVVWPNDVSVEVEGVATPVTNGIIEITGAPGSIHRVRVFKGTSQTTTDVIVTESGPSPPKVELRFGAFVKPSTPGAPTTPGQTGTAVSPPPSQPGIIDKFE